MSFLFILQFEFFAQFFSDAFRILFTVALLLVGMILGVLIRIYLWRPKNQVMYCRERDRRGHEMDLKEEDAISFLTKTDPALRFYKWGGAFEFIKRGRAFTRFFGKEGTAYSWVLQGFHKVATKFQEVKQTVEHPSPTNPNETIKEEVTKKVPIEWEEKKIELPFPTLEEAVKSKWGDDYDRTPEELKAKLREEKLLVTVGLEPGLTPEDYPVITESTVNAKGDEDAASLIGEELKQATKKDYLTIIITMLAGAGAALAILVALGKVAI